MRQISINSEHFNCRTNLGLTDGKYFMKLSFDVKIKTGIFQISIRLNFNKF